MTQRNLNLVFSTHPQETKFSSNEPFYNANSVVVAPVSSHNYCPYALDIHNRVVACNCSEEKRRECEADI